MGSSAGGVFLPNDPPPSTNQVLTTPSILGGTISGATISGGTQTSTGSTFVTPGITGATITGVVTVASGAAITTPTVIFTAQNVTATGTDATGALTLSAVVPVFVTMTGASGAGVAIPTGAGVAGGMYVIRNMSTTGAIGVYAIGGSINGTTGTTIFPITTTGNKTAMFFCTVAGAWNAVFVT